MIKKTMPEKIQDMITVACELWHVADDNDDEDVANHLKIAITSLRYALTKAEK